jgi:transcription initiation factor IIF auxiliary subunit
MRSWELKAACEVLKTIDGKVKFAVLREGGREHYHVRVFLKGPAERLDEIERVEYLLHPTFRERSRQSDDRKSGFAIEFWTWGQFDIDITLALRGGGRETMRYFLRYSLPHDTGENYAQVQVS